MSPRLRALHWHALLAVATAIVVAGWLMLPEGWGERIPFSAFVVIVGFASILEGLRLGLLALVLGAIAGLYFGKPRFMWTLESRLDVIDLGLFVVMGLWASIGGSRLRRALRDSRKDRKALRAAHEALARRAREELSRLEHQVAARTAALKEVIAERERLLAEREAMHAREYAARVEAERASLIRDEFLATAAHELRTPLHAILGWSDLLGRAASGERLTRGLDVIRRNAAALARIVSDLVDTSRLQTGKLRIATELVEVLELVNAALDEARIAARAKKVELRVHLAPAKVLGDPCRLQQVVMNLASNAIKFTPAGGHVDVSVTCCEGHVILTVRDDGQGIAADFLPFVFERFRQADTSISRTGGGLGLGLAIVQHIVTLHGGSVAAASEGPNRGATFTVTLPAATGSARNASATGGTGADLHGISVLVVDDQPDARELARIILHECGARVTVAGSGLEALQECTASVPDVLVTDIGMPGMDGYALAAHLRDVPAVALTAYARPEDHERALATGFRGYVTKPLDPTSLVAAVVACCKRTTDSTMSFGGAS